ncbi:MAG: hypothetical protein F6K50_03555 [Moorea sp. SIO3I7]|uniref:hypothetical protein n=1 Tax=Moorena sp. SIO3I8 TaxID=2607833 RepID=UPI0013BF9958|nr:hypothetical protein [Moorena sp. SIO3I8]NEN94635.1 hypothetical protein [Moorena sp. SIO3I7]NEO04243.1 hypothetical protein [Moorena sp. SIO3I8]
MGNRESGIGNRESGVGIREVSYQLLAIRYQLSAYAHATRSVLLNKRCSGLGHRLEACATADC